MRCSRSGSLAESALEELLGDACGVSITAEQALPSTVKRNRTVMGWSRILMEGLMEAAA